MAKYRYVHVSFWQDAKVLEEMTPEDKYFYIYLLTNPNTTQIGIYQITKKQMAFELGYSIESINSLVERFENVHKVIKYNPQTREIALLNWGKYNLIKGGKPVLDCIEKELMEVKDTSLIGLVARKIPNESIRELFLRYANDTSYDTYHDTLDDTSTIRTTLSGEKEKEKQKEKEYYYPGNDDDIADVGRFYQANIGVLAPIVSESIEYWCRDLSPELVKEAIKRAATNNVRRWSYIEEILKNWKDNNVTTVEEAMSLDAQWKNKKDETAIRPAHQPLKNVNFLF
ncbi:DnaD domain-containing protein [Parageobacillus thermoglucosidasius]|uniref:DnaD domain-containing protein n=1 Tax=Parageobacillus thermoglucosidasius TaxID=1426 RepID=UPI0001D1734D|nr:DnaD domain protein [Parageobacillus thermoglucosidasius]AEH46758.1 primosome, DnaD subunit [Parageobacillus thermoglucosidasius C56-YS93]